jgi:peptidoglycan/LPS O-acetylase OafA/YrhL
MTAPRHYFPALDGLTAFAVLAVFAFHLTPCVRTLSGNETHSPLFGLLELGLMGVDLFFALSGFLITTGLLSSRQSQTTVNYFRLFF